MVFIKWLLCGCLSIPMTILGKALCWVLPFFVDEETKRLPKWLDWFMTDDNDADGDAGHWERNPGTGKWATYVRRTKWFWRNTCYGFDREVVGIKCWSTDVIKFTGDADVGRKPFRPGVNWHHLYRNGKLIGFQWYFVCAWPWGLFPKRCIRGNFGWKLWANKTETEDWAQWTGMCNPFFNRED